MILIDLLFLSVRVLSVIGEVVEWLISSFVFDCSTSQELRLSAAVALKVEEVDSHIWLCWSLKICMME